MDPITLSLIMAGIGAGGSVLSGLLGFAGSKSSASEQSKQAKRQRAWLERMAKTAHQREVKDLRKAGLNPVLSATGGSGATTPSATVPSTPDYGSTLSEIGRFEQAINLASAFGNLRLINSQVESQDLQNEILKPEAEFASSPAGVQNLRDRKDNEAFPGPITSAARWLGSSAKSLVDNYKKLPKELRDLVRAKSSMAYPVDRTLKNRNRNSVPVSRSSGTVRIFEHFVDNDDGSRTYYYRKGKKVK